MYRRRSDGNFTHTYRNIKENAALGALQSGIERSVVRTQGCQEYYLTVFDVVELENKNKILLSLP